MSWCQSVPLPLPRCPSALVSQCPSIIVSECSQCPSVLVSGLVIKIGQRSDRLSERSGPPGRSDRSLFHWLPVIVWLITWWKQLPRDAPISACYLWYSCKTGFVVRSEIDDEGSGKKWRSLSLVRMSQCPSHPGRGTRMHTIMGTDTHTHMWTHLGSYRRDAHL